MALVGKIREKSGLIVFIVGLGLLLFIIPFDSIYRGFQGGGEQPIGELYGKPILDSEWKFNDRVQQYIANRYGMLPEEYKIQEETRQWQQTMVDTVLKTEIAKIGLRVSADELTNFLILGKNPSQNIKDMFSYEIGPNNEKVFVRDSLLKWYQNLSSQKNAAQGDQKTQIENYLHYNIEMPIKAQRLQDKYIAMAKYAVIGTNAEVNKSLISKNAAVKVSYVTKMASELPDSTVKVTEKDIQAYYAAHKNEPKWKTQDDIRELEYVLINIKPTAKDKEALVEKMEKLKKGFAETSNDTIFIDGNSDTKVGAAQQAQQQGITGVLDVLPFREFDKFNTPFGMDAAEQIANAEKGQVVGPFDYVDESGNTNVVIAKVTDSYSSETETQVRHILIGTENMTDSEVASQKKLADSLVNVLKADNSKFGLLANQYTDDVQGFASNKGYYYVFPEASLVPEFKDFGLNNPVGSIASVKTDFGYHVMEVVAKSPMHKYVAYVEKSVTPSKATKDAVFEEQGFAFMEKASGDFEKAAEPFGFDVQTDQLYLSYPMTQQLGYNSDLVEWAFKEGRKIGDVSKPIATKDNKFVVAKIKAVGNYGEPTYEIVKEAMEAEVLKEKEIDYLYNLVKDVKSLEEASTLLPGVGAGTTQDKLTLDMNSYPAKNRDVKAVAKTFLINNLNEVNVIKGSEGVYVVMVTEKNITPIPAETALEKESITQTRQNSVDNTIVYSLLKAADARDWRMKSKIYYANQED